MGMIKMRKIMIFSIEVFFLHARYHCSLEPLFAFGWEYIVLDEQS